MINKQLRPIILQHVLKALGMASFLWVAVLFPLKAAALVISIVIAVSILIILIAETNYALKENSVEDPAEEEEEEL